MYRGPLFQGKKILTDKTFHNSLSLTYIYSILSQIKEVSSLHTADSSMKKTVVHKHPDYLDCSLAENMKTDCFLMVWRLYYLWTYSMPLWSNSKSRRVSTKIDCLPINVSSISFLWYLRSNAYSSIVCKNKLKLLLAEL